MKAAKGDYWYSVLYWKLRAVAERSATVSRLLEKVRLKYALHKDPLLSLMKLQVAPGSVIYDVGAHIGTYSIVLAKEIEQCQVYSFEPNPQSYARLVKNISLMRVKVNAIPKNIALGSNVSQPIFYISSSSGLSSFYEHHAKAGGNEVVTTLPVDCYTVDYLVSNGVCKPPDVLKIDVEGHEFEVIKGCENTIASKSPQIFFEPHEVVQWEKIVNFLVKNFNYTCKSLGYPIWCYKENH
jgi:FkbM family methyltransferase